MDEQTPWREGCENIFNQFKPRIPKSFCETKRGKETEREREGEGERETETERD
jgi:hypothetical protein